MDCVKFVRWVIKTIHDGCNFGVCTKIAFSGIYLKDACVWLCFIMAGTVSDFPDFWDNYVIKLDVKYIYFLKCMYVAN